MTIIRTNGGKLTNATRAIKRNRRHARKRSETSGKPPKAFTSSQTSFECSGFSYESRVLVAVMSFTFREYSNNDDYVKQYRLQKTYEKFDSSSVLAPLTRRPLGTNSKIVDLICS